MRYFLGELVLVGAAAALGLMLFPGHPVGVMVVIVVSWLLFLVTCIFAFMAALYKGDIVEYRTKPRSYALAPRASVHWLARRFLMSYLRVAASRPSSLPGAVEEVRR